MTEQQAFFIDLINLMPLGSTLFIQSPDLETKSILQIMETTQFDYFKKIVLTSENKNVLFSDIVSNNIQENIQLIEIRDKEELLFEGYDGVKFGTISKKIKLPDDFVYNYIDKDICTISINW
jgi:hypothetical protein